MRKVLGLFVLATMLLTVGFASAGVPICATVETTYVSGIITDSTHGNAPVSGAEVTVNCNGHIQTTTSAGDGSYTVQFDASECTDGDPVSVSASFDGLNGSNDEPQWSTGNETIGCLKLIVNVACANVPLVPEFGTVVGVLTALGALGTFFVVRKK